MFKIPGFSALYNSDGYKVGHKSMLAPNTTRLYGTWIPRSLKYGPKGATKVVSFGQQLVVKWLHHEFEENFFQREMCNMLKSFPEDIQGIKDESLQFIKDMSLYLNLPYDGKHFEELWDLGYLPIEIQSLPEGIETNPNIPHMTFINTVDGFAWLTLYLETFISSLAWKAPTSATTALQYKKKCYEYVMKTDPENAWLIPWLCHDFSARGLDPYSQIASGLGHATCFLGSDTLPIIPSARFFYNEPLDQVCIGSVNASEHSVSTTEIFTVGERQMIIDWLTRIPEGIFSMVCDTFSTWQFIDYLRDPEIKELVINRKGKLVVRPDSGDPVDIICGELFTQDGSYLGNKPELALPGDDSPQNKGVIELLADVFGYTVNEQGYKVLPPYIGAIYGDSINLERQEQIYQRLAAKGFAATNIVLGVGSFTYQMNTRDTLGFAAKGAWFEVKEPIMTSPQSVGFDKKGYNIYKDPITDTSKSKKSLKGFQLVLLEGGEYISIGEVNEDRAYSEENILKTIYKNGIFYNETTLTEIRTRMDSNL